MLTGGTLLSRVIQLKLNNQDIFNKENETFPLQKNLEEADQEYQLYYLAIEAPQFCR